MSSSSTEAATDLASLALHNLPLRERKKIRTRLAIQDEAMRLFLDQGYDNTTVEQICAAAEVSPSTFFRYFPTKEDVILDDGYDPVIMALYRSQPPELGPMQAMRATMRTLTAAMPQEEKDRLQQRLVLSAQVPALRAATLDNLMQNVDMFAALIAERVGRKPDDFAVRTMAGAILGVWIPEILSMHKGAAAWEDSWDRLDDALALLEAGLPLED
jgi:AcrR family transcriptional regulator